MKPRLLILSDIFGGENPEWIKEYKSLLDGKFEVHYYDVCGLANIDLNHLTEKELHQQFLNGGIDNAVENLLQLEKGNVVVLGFSIGGTIAWKAALHGLNVSYLFTVSSTRLRFETQLPNCKIRLYFGENDPNQPQSEWFSSLHVSKYVFKNKEHNLYLEKENAGKICSDILKDL